MPKGLCWVVPPHPLPCSLSEAPAPPVAPTCCRGTMHPVPTGALLLGLALLVCGSHAFFLPNGTQLEALLGKYQQAGPHARVRRAIPLSDREEILLLHNKMRGQVNPPASNMEYMVSPGTSGVPPTGSTWGVPGPVSSSVNCEQSQNPLWKARPPLRPFTPFGNMV